MRAGARSGAARSWPRAASAVARMAAVGGLALAGCGDDASAPDGEAPMMALELALEIGSVDGAEEFVFAALETVRPIDGGAVLVSDGGNTRISIYEADGAFRTSFGSEGEGPGEFGNLARVYAHGPDSILASERFEDRLTFFSLDGEVGRTSTASEVSGDETFKLDSWFHGRYWVEGALTDAERASVRDLLDRLASPPMTWPGYRRVAAADDGSIWIAEPRGATTTAWTNVDEEGAARATVEIPHAFRPTHWGADSVWGVWTGESDLHFARVYALRASGGTAATPGWLARGGVRTDGAEADAAPDDTPNEAPTEADVLDLVRPVIRAMASAQEIHYSSAMSYTSDIADLEDLEVPASLHVDVPLGDPRGWIGIFVHRDTDRACALGYGFSMPPGWIPGQMSCAPTAPGY